MSYLDDIVSAQKHGQALGITSICSAHPLVLEAVLEYGKSTEAHILIEATCNQVNQFGGYTGMQPKDFVRFIDELAVRLDFPRANLMLGGDHLGPTPWQAEPASVAMAKSKTLVRDYVLAGFSKIHLDASMRLGDDPPGPLPVEVAANRAAELAEVAEETARQHGNPQSLRYVIGTEVPIAGGLQEDESNLEVTEISDFEKSLEKSRAAFLTGGLESAWERVVAAVVQPGVEYGDASIHAYNRSATVELTRFIEDQPLVYEAHSTDYQTQSALQQMVEDHFAILKVGPALTFALREAIFNLAMIENELFPPRKRSGLFDVLDQAMVSDPVHWRKYYHGSSAAQAFARKFSFSDRSRYYWAVPQVQTALQKLIFNLDQQPISLTLLSQFLPLQYQKVRDGILDPSPLRLIKDNVLEVFRGYQGSIRHRND